MESPPETAPRWRALDDHNPLKAPTGLPPTHPPFMHNTLHACRGHVGTVISMGMNDPDARRWNNPLHNASPLGSTPVLSPSVGMEWPKPCPNLSTGLEAQQPERFFAHTQTQPVLPKHCSSGNIRGTAPIRGGGRRLRVAGGERNPARTEWSPTQRPTILKASINQRGGRGWPTHCSSASNIRQCTPSGTEMTRQLASPLRLR